MDKTCDGVDKKNFEELADDGRVDGKQGHVSYARHETRERHRSQTRLETTLTLSKLVGEKVTRLTWKVY